MDLFRTIFAAVTVVIHAVFGATQAPEVPTPSPTVIVETSSQTVTGALTTGIKYTVQDGDTLSFIANDFAVTERAILEANLLGNATDIRPGLVLTIPKTRPTTPAPPPPPAKPLVPGAEANLAMIRSYLGDITPSAYQNLCAVGANALTGMFREDEVLSADRLSVTTVRHYYTVADFAYCYLIGEGYSVITAGQAIAYFTTPLEAGDDDAVRFAKIQHNSELAAQLSNQKIVLVHIQKVRSHAGFSKPTERYAYFIKVALPENSLYRLSEGGIYSQGEHTLDISRLSYQLTPAWNPLTWYVGPVSNSEPTPTPCIPAKGGGCVQMPDPA